MKKIIALLAATVLTFGLISCSKNSELPYPLEPLGVELPIKQEFLDKGLVIDCYGTDMTIYPVAIVGFQDKSVLENLYAQAYETWSSIENDEEREAFTADFEKEIYNHQKLIGEMAVIPSDQYKEFMKNPPEDYEFITGMKVIAKKHGNTYLLSQVENTTEGMSEEEAQSYYECRDHFFDAVKKAKYNKIKIEPKKYDENLSQSPNGGRAFPMFASVDLNGETITEQVFNQKDVTLLMLWKMDGCDNSDVKEIAQWSKSLPENVQLVGIVGDINSPTDGEKINQAKEIVGDSFTNIIAAGALETLFDYFTELPTVMVVEKNQDIWGDALNNATVDSCTQMLSLWFEADARIKAMEKEE